MKNNLLYALLLATLCCFAQPKDIELPKGGEQMTISEGTFILSFYITKNQEVFLEDQKINFYNEIASRTLQAIRSIPDNFHGPTIYYIYADINVAYKFVDKIKTEISKVVFPRIDYKTGSYENVMLTTPSWLHSSLNERLIDDKILTLEEQQEKEKATEMVFGPPPPPAFWQETFGYDLYNLNNNEIKRVLDKHSAIALTLLPNEELLFKGDVYKISDVDFLNDLHLKYDILFLRYGKDLSYGNYIKAKQQLRKIGSSLDDKSQPSAYKIEISYDLEGKLKENKLDIFE